MDENENAFGAKAHPSVLAELNFKTSSLSSKFGQPNSNFLSFVAIEKKLDIFLALCEQSVAARQSVRYHCKKSEFHCQQKLQCMVNK